MARTYMEITARKRWFFWPVALAMVCLGKIGILKSPDAAGKWLADHAMRIEVR